MPKAIDIEGLDRFLGDVYFTSTWPHEGVDLTGKRVAVIGTGSSGIQSIPLIAEQARELVVFQRTPNFSIPAHNGPPSQERLDEIASRSRRLPAVRQVVARRHALRDPGRHGCLLPPDEQQARFEAAWEAGELFSILGTFADVLINREANDVVAEHIRRKIREIVKDPETAEVLCPTDHPFGTKRPCLDTNYFATFNLSHVRLVDLHKHPIRSITSTASTQSTSPSSSTCRPRHRLRRHDGGDRVRRHHRARRAEPEGEVGARPDDVPRADDDELPEPVPDHRPGQSVRAVQHGGLHRATRRLGGGLPGVPAGQRVRRIEPTDTAEAGWVQHTNDCADITLYPLANSWYMGANVPGKPRVFLPYIGGVDTYRGACDEVVERGYFGFELSGPAGRQRNDGVIRRLQPDVFAVLTLLEQLNLPLLESMSPTDARAFFDVMNADRPLGPEVGEIVDGELPGADGLLEYRLYRPATPGPHPIVAYFHGGGWVLGTKDSDEPLCRDLCVSADAVIVSVNYRHAPEACFPAAAEDGFAAVQWIAAHSQELGGIPGQLAVAGWSAGGNVAAVACQMARDAGGPEIVGQLLLTPITDCDMETASYIENADGFVLTAPLMQWFWDHYADADERTDPRAAPLRAADLSGLPPACVVTCEFDPLRDEGNAYAQALEKAGVPVRVIAARGHTHTSLTMVGIVISGAGVRAEMAEALREFFQASVPA